MHLLLTAAFKFPPYKKAPFPPSSFWVRPRRDGRGLVLIPYILVSHVIDFTYFLIAKILNLRNFNNPNFCQFRRLMIKLSVLEMTINKV